MESIQHPKLVRIALLPGDGQGPLLACHVKKVLELIQSSRDNVAFQVSQHPFGGAALAAGTDSALPLPTLQACLASDAVVLCGFGDERHVTDPEKGLLALRQHLRAFANIRPISLPSPGLVKQNSYESELIEILDVTFVSEIATSGHHGLRKEVDGGGDTSEYNRQEVEELARLAGKYAMQFSRPRPIHCIEQSHSQPNSTLWRSVVGQLFNQEFPQLIVDYVPMDTALMLLESNPENLYGIVLAESMLADILFDQARSKLMSQEILASSTLPALSRHMHDKPAIFEPLQVGSSGTSSNPLGIIQAVIMMLRISLGLGAEADALEMAIRRTLDPVELVGSGVRTVDLGGSATAEEFTDMVLHHLTYYLETSGSRGSVPDHVAQSGPEPLPIGGRRPMGVIEKIITQAGVGLEKPEIEPGQMICVKVDWTLTSELLWGGMEKTYNRMGRPRLHRNDRLWLAVDHTVDPRTNNRPRQRGLIENAKKFQREAKIIDFLPANTSIMHTDFTRERAQPGRIVVGSDSHTCSAGSMGALAVGFGAADVVMPMVTGETWFRSPEVCRINFVGKLPFGCSGKDVILHILGIFKRNTIAFQRAVEYGGPSLKELSMDARFAIANMTTEFGGMGTCFEADERTAAWIADRPHREHREGGIYFRADPGAQYAEQRTIDLSAVQLTVALYPNPDHVVPVSEKVGMKLDGCFIGACTTTEEDLIVGALVLEAGLRAGMVPTPRGSRRVTPGSLTIIKHLERQGLLSIYRQAGFGIGAPGCSYCVGINDVDVAGEGEVWLSSQNRNFRNRMGKGSIGNITSAAVVAASSFGMKVTDPAPLLDQLDKERLKRLIRRDDKRAMNMPKISEPHPEISSQPTKNGLNGIGPSHDTNDGTENTIRSTIQLFGENVDTDAIIPAEFMPGIDNADLGSHCFEYFRPEFREQAKSGSRIIVADHGFGSGSSREDAVRALQGAGIEAVIAKGFAFIYERNQLNMGLYNIKMQDPEFYASLDEDSIVTIDKEAKTVAIEGTQKIFHYEHSEVEEALLRGGGVLSLYSQFQSDIFRKITAPGFRSRRKLKAMDNAESAPCQGGAMSRKLDW